MNTVVFEEGVLIFAPLFGGAKTQLVSLRKASSLAKRWDKIARQYGQQGYSAPSARITSEFYEGKQTVSAHGPFGEKAIEWLKGQPPAWLGRRIMSRAAFVAA